MVKSRVVRTYPNGWNVTSERLQSVMDEGYRVSRVTSFKGTQGETLYLEYILEKEVE